MFFHTSLSTHIKPSRYFLLFGSLFFFAPVEFANANSYVAYRQLRPELIVPVSTPACAFF